MNKCETVEDLLVDMCDVLASMYSYEYIVDLYNKISLYKKYRHIGDGFVEETTDDD